MTVTNVVAWTYQYLLPGVLLWLGLMATDPARPGAARGRRGGGLRGRPEIRG